MSNKTGRKNHTHKYEFMDGLWSCAKSDCTHYLPKNYRCGLPLGLNSVCWNCERKFVIDNISIGQVKPICENCDMDNPLRIVNTDVVNME